MLLVSVLLMPEKIRSSLPATGAVPPSQLLVSVHVLVALRPPVQVRVVAKTSPAKKEPPAVAAARTSILRLIDRMICSPLVELDMC